MTDFDIKVKNANVIRVFGTEDETMVFPSAAKIDTSRSNCDVVIDGLSEVKIGLPKNSEEIELACAGAAIFISDLSFESFEIDGKGDLKIDAEDIEGSLEINLVSGSAELTVPSGFSFRAKNAGKNCIIDSEADDVIDSTNTVELNGKDSKLTIRVR